MNKNETPPNNTKLNNNHNNEVTVIKQNILINNINRIFYQKQKYESIS